jgi:hypothetical protein
MDLSLPAGVISSPPTARLRLGSIAILGCLLLITRSTLRLTSAPIFLPPIRPQRPFAPPPPLPGFLAVIQAVVSVVSDQGDTIRWVTAGRTHIAFLLAGPLYLVAASSAAEPLPSLRRQLELMHHQLLFLVTSGESRRVRGAR